MYVCATGSIPIAVSLMAKGLTPGAALVLLMAGPAVNSASILVIGKTFGRHTLRLYILSIIIGAVVFGLMIDYLLPQTWFAVSSNFTEAAHCAHCLTVWNWICIIVFSALLINAFILRLHRSHSLKQEHHCKADGNPTIIYNVSGMNCNHCKSSVEKCILAIAGVEEVDVDLTNGKAYVSGTHDSQTVIEAVNAIGFECSLA